MAHRILDLDDQIGEIYHNRDTYIATGQVPVKNKLPDDLVTDPKKYPQALHNASRYVRDYKRKLKAAPGDTNIAAQLAKWQGRVEHYQNLMQ